MANGSARAKTLVGICSLVAALYFPFGQAYGSPNFNTLLALHSTNMEESTEILTIFPWYSYVVGLFIFALGVIAVRRKAEEKKRGEKLSTCAWRSAWWRSLSHQYKTWPGAGFSS